MWLLDEKLASSLDTKAWIHVPGNMVFCNNATPQYNKFEIFDWAEILIFFPISRFLV